MIIAVIDNRNGAFPATGEECWGNSEADLQITAPAALISKKKNDPGGPLSVYLACLDAATYRALYSVPNGWLNLS